MRISHFISPFLFTDFEVRTVFMGKKINKLVENLKILHRIRDSHTISLNDKCASIVHRHNVYIKFLEK